MSIKDTVVYCYIYYGVITMKQHHYCIPLLASIAVQTKPFLLMIYCL